MKTRWQGTWLLDHRMRWLLMALGATFVMLLFARPWLSNHLVDLGYEMERLRQAHNGVSSLHRALRVEAESLNAVARIEQIAVQQLHMKSAHPRQRIYIPVHVNETRPHMENR